MDFLGAIEWLVYFKPFPVSLLWFNYFAVSYLYAFCLRNAIQGHCILFIINCPVIRSVIIFKIIFAYFYLQMCVAGVSSIVNCEGQISEDENILDSQVFYNFNSDDSALIMD